MTAGERFHRHLDVCVQCREHPFDLCILGGVLLMSTVVSVVRRNNENVDGGPACDVPQTSTR